MIWYVIVIIIIHAHQLLCSSCLATWFFFRNKILIYMRYCYYLCIYHLLNVICQPCRTHLHDSVLEVSKYEYSWDTLVVIIQAHPPPCWVQLYTSRADLGLRPSQWEMALLYNNVSHWSGHKPRISPDFNLKEKKSWIFMRLSYYSCVLSIVTTLPCTQWLQSILLTIFHS